MLVSRMKLPGKFDWFKSQPVIWNDIVYSIDD